MRDYRSPPVIAEQFAGVIGKAYPTIDVGEWAGLQFFAFAGASTNFVLLLTWNATHDNAVLGQSTSREFVVGASGFTHAMRNLDRYLTISVFNPVAGAEFELELINEPIPEPYELQPHTGISPGVLLNLVTGPIAALGVVTVAIPPYTGPAILSYNTGSVLMVATITGKDRGGTVAQLYSTPGDNIAGMAKELWLPPLLNTLTVTNTDGAGPHSAIVTIIPTS